MHIIVPAMASSAQPLLSAQGVTDKNKLLQLVEEAPGWYAWSMVLAWTPSLSSYSNQLPKDDTGYEASRI